MVNQLYTLYGKIHNLHKNDKKSLENKLEEIMTKLKSPNETTKAEEKGTDTNPFNITTQEDDKLFEVKTYASVIVWMTEISIREGNYICQVNQQKQDKGKSNHNKSAPKS